MNPVRVALGLSMDASIISALAALVGATVGGLTSVLATWLAHRTQANAQWLAQETIRRQELYKEFIEEAAKCYADALQHEKPEIPAWVELYAKIGRMRVVSSPRVVISAEQVGQKIIDTYIEPNKTFVEVARDDRHEGDRYSWRLQRCLPGRIQITSHSSIVKQTPRSVWSCRPDAANSEKATSALPRFLPSCRRLSWPLPLRRSNQAPARRTPICPGDL